MAWGYLLRGARWRIWERGLTYWDSLGLVLIGFMGNNVLPARLGELLRAHCGACKMRGDRGRIAVLASIAAERILDGLLLAIIGLIGMSLAPMDRRLRWSLLLVSVVFGALASALIFSIRFHEAIRRLIAIANRKFPGHMTSFAEEKANHLLDGLMPLRKISRLASAIAGTAAIWSLEIGFYYCVGLSVWNGMSLRVALLLLVVVNFASLIPLTMGGIGTIEAAALAFLTSSGVASYPALAMILLQHAGQYFFTTVAGGTFYFASGFYRIRSPSPSLLPVRNR